MNYKELISKLWNEISKLVDNKIKKLNYDKTFKSTIWGKNDDGTYQISYLNQIYNVPNALGTELELGQSVWVCIPSGVFRNMHIYAGGNGSVLNCDSELSETSENPVQNKVITQKLNEVFQSVSNGKSLIASAITDKGIETTADATFEIMAENIGMISSGKFASPADIYNHGNVVGVNQYYNSISHGKQSSTTTPWSISNEKISAIYWDNKAFVFMAPIIRGNYTKIHIDCEVTSGANGQYNNFLVCYRNPSYGALVNDNQNIEQIGSVIWYGGQFNYDGSEPWYTLQRQVVEFDITRFAEDEPWWLGFRNCDCVVNIYSIWLE